MNKKHLLTAVVTLLGMGSALADDTQGNWYVGGAIGSSKVASEDIQRTTFIAPATTITNQQRSTEDGRASWSVGGGYRSPMAWSLEVELAHRPGPVQTLANLPSGALSGNTIRLSSTSLMFNAAYSIPTQTAVRPYVGVGIGPTRLSGAAADSVGSSSSDKWALGYQWLVGVEWQVSKPWSLYVQVQQLHVPNVDLTMSHTLSTTTVTRVVNDFQSRTVSAGVRYSF